VSEEGVVKILDFGLAKLVEPADPGQPPGEATKETETASPGTLPGVVAGTAGYMSPEQASGVKVDARSDVFAFGAVLYEMVTGRRAFSRRSTAEALAAVLKEQPRPTTELVPGIPPALERLIARCLRKEPDRRPQHMVDVAVELEDIRDEMTREASARPTARGRSPIWWALALLGSGSVVLLAWTLNRRQAVQPAAYVVRLAATRTADSATFSPDGTQVAICMLDEKLENMDIYLRLVGGTEERRLTTDPARDWGPSWSPDGKQIAFIRDPSIYLVSPLGGTERRFLDFPASTRPRWSPDGRWLAVSRQRSADERTPESAGIHIVSVPAGNALVATQAKWPSFHVFPDFSPDGHTLAYSACTRVAAGVAACDVHVLSLDERVRPVGGARQLTHQGLWHSGLVWARDGRSIIYSDGFTQRARLWRVLADGSQSPEELPLGRGGSTPFMPRNSDRLGFLRNLTDVDIYRLQEGSRVAPIFASTGWDLLPAYSPDGRHIAFNSDRDNKGYEVFLASADGSNVSQLTRGDGKGQGNGAASWSPDGQRIAFDSQGGDSHFSIWSIDVDGGGLRQMTHGSADDSVPSWSRDGRWIYFSSNRTGRFEIWRVPSEGGAEEQVTHHGGYFARESLDGQTLYFKRKDGVAPLVARSRFGVEREVVNCTSVFGYAVTQEGILHLDCQYSRDSPERRSVRLWIASTGREREIALVDTGRWSVMGLAVSPDGRTILYTHANQSSDVMMIENFH
jgi:Tol biopolymer transport system component